MKNSLIIITTILFLNSCITKPVVLTMKDKEIIPEKSYYEMMLDSFLNEPFQPVYDWETVIVDGKEIIRYVAPSNSILQRLSLPPQTIPIKDLPEPFKSKFDSLQSSSKLDTIPTILIYIDTSWVVLSEFELAEAGLSDIYSKSIKYEIKDYNIKWMNGYEIREKSAVGGGGTAVPLPVDWVHYTTIEYLNENKQPLSKNIIVLMTK